MQKVGPNNSDILQNWCRPKIRSTFLNLLKFHESEKSLRDLCRMDWNLMNEKESGSKELLRLKYRKRDQRIQTFSKIGFPEKLGPLSLISWNFKALRKIPLNHAEYVEMEWTTKSLGLENLENWNTEVMTK